MAKGARASTTKANNSKLKSRVFGPVETDRTARLSAKLLELASQPKPTPRAKKADVSVDGEEAAADKTEAAPVPEAKATEAMDIDQAVPKPMSKKAAKARIEKKRSSSRKASIVFPKYKEGKRVARGAKK